MPFDLVMRECCVPVVPAVEYGRLFSVFQGPIISLARTKFGHATDSLTFSLDPRRQLITKFLKMSLLPAAHSSRAR